MRRGRTYFRLSLHLEHFKPNDLQSEGQRGHTCGGKCGEVHDGVYRSTTGYQKYGKEGHFWPDIVVNNISPQIKELEFVIIVIRLAI